MPKELTDFDAKPTAKASAKEPVTVEVLERHQPRSLTSPPPELVAWAAGKGKQVNFARADSRLLAQESMYGRFPLLLDELPKELQTVATKYFDPPAMNQGRLQRGDSCILIQSIEERDAWRVEHASIQASFENAEQELAERQNDEIRRTAKARGLSGMVELDASRVPSVASHVEGGKDLYRRLLEEAAAASE